MKYPADKLYTNIESWLDGQMTKEEANKFENQLEKDETLRELVKQHKLAREVIDDWIVDDYRTKIKSWSNELPAPVPKTPISIKKILWLLPIGILLVISVLYLNNRKSIMKTEESPALNLPQPIIPTPGNIPSVKDSSTLKKSDNDTKLQNREAVKPVPPVFADKSKKENDKKNKGNVINPSLKENGLLAMADEQLDDYRNRTEEKYAVSTRGDDRNDFEEGRIAFINKDNQKAIKALLKAIELNDQYKTDALELLAILYYKEKDYQNAATIFEQFAPRKRGQETDWRLTMFYLADYSHQKEKLKDQLNKIISTEGHKYQINAQDLKKELITQRIIN